MKQFLFALLFLALPAFSQTTVTGTVTDTDGLAWANGTWSINFYPTASAPQVPSGVPANYSGTLNGSGQYSQTLPYVTASGAQWTWKVCPLAAAPCQSFGPYQVSGSTQTVNLTPGALRFPASVSTYGYSTAELITTAQPGWQFWNTTSLSCEQWTSASWTSCSSGGAGNPGGTSGQVQYNNAGVFGGFTLSGDGTLNTSTGALTVTKTNGTAFGSLATLSTINNANWSGTVLAVGNGGSGTGSALSGILRGGSPFTAAEISGDCTTSGSNAITCTKTSGTLFGALATSAYPTSGIPNSTGSAWGTSYSSSNQIPANFIPTLNQNTTGNAATASALTSAPSQCSGGQFATGIAVSGNANCGTPTGSGTVNSGTANHISYYAASGTAVSSDANLDDGATAANTLTYGGTGGIAATHGFTATSDGTHAGLMSIIGNTTVPTSLPSNSFGFLAPNSASFTSYFLQPSATAPSGTQFITAGTPSGNVSAMNYVSSTGSGSVVLATSPTLVTPALGTPTALVGTNITGTATGLTAGLAQNLTGSPAITVSSCTGCSSGIANTTFTTATTAIGANACSASAVTVTLTGLATSSVIIITPSTDVSGSTGWGSSGGLVIDAWPSATNTMSYKVCNQTASSITPAAVTWNVGAR